MINRINDNDYYDYSKLKMPNAADKTTSGESFGLSYQRAQEKSEGKEKKDEEQEGKTVQSSRPHTVTQGGVRLELSEKGRENANKESSKSGKQTQEMVQDILDNVRGFISKFIQSVKGFFYRVWNDPPKKEDADVQDILAAQPVEEEEKLTEEYLDLNHLVPPREVRENRKEALNGIPGGADRDKEIQQYLRSGNLEQVLSLLTDNGRKTMAKNSSLLTYYDRTGRLAQPSASDQERILHGDRNVRKL